MKCFSGVDVLNAVLRKVTIMRLDKVDKEGGDVTKVFYNRESGPLATAAAISIYRGQGLDLCKSSKMEKGTWQSPLSQFLLESRRLINVAAGLQTSSVSELHHRAAGQCRIAGDHGRSALEEMPGRILLHIRIL